MLEYKSVTAPRWLNEAKTLIVCEVDFPHLGGVHTFVADSADSEEHGRAIFADLTAGKYGPIAPYTAPKPVSPLIPYTVTDVKFFGELVKRSLITQTEALAAVAAGELPKALATAIDSLSKDDAFDARMYFMGSSVLSRNEPSVGKVLHLAFDMDDDAVLALFAAAGK